MCSKVRIIYGRIWPKYANWNMTYGLENNIYRKSPACNAWASIFKNAELDTHINLYVRNDFYLGKKWFSWIYLYLYLYLSIYLSIYPSIYA